MYIFFFNQHFAIEVSFHLQCSITITKHNHKITTSNYILGQNILNKLLFEEKFVFLPSPN